MKIDVLHINDVHGYLEPHAELFYKNNEEYTDITGGYARIASIIKEVMHNNPNTLLFDGGDTFHGTLPVVDTHGQILIPILNNLPITAMTGHWDFGYGPVQLKKLLSQLHYPMLSINVYNRDGTLFLNPYIILQVGDIKIGVIGICSDIINKTMPKHFSEGLTVTNGLDELPIYINKIKSEKADIIILLSHNGFPQDVSMLQKIQGIDICLSAHTHNRLYKPISVNDSIIIQCGCHGSFIGHLTLNIANKAIKGYEYELIKVNESITPDAEMEMLVNTSIVKFQHTKNNIVGKTTQLLHRYNTLNSNLDNLLLTSIKYVSNSEIAFSNGWRYGTPIPAGNITEWDLFNIIPTNPLVSTVILSGEEIVEMLEQNLERTFSANPMEQMGGYVKRCVGLRINIRIENPNGQRIQEIYYNDLPLDRNKKYNVAFVTSQGVPEHIGTNRKNLEIHAVDAIKSYLSYNPVFGHKITDTFYLI